MHLDKKSMKITKALPLFSFKSKTFAIKAISPLCFSCLCALGISSMMITDSFASPWLKSSQDSILLNTAELYAFREGGSVSFGSNYSTRSSSNVIEANPQDASNADLEQDFADAAFEAQDEEEQKEKAFTGIKDPVNVHPQNNTEQQNQTPLKAKSNRLDPNTPYNGNHQVYYSHGTAAHFGADADERAARQERMANIRRYKEQENSSNSQNSSTNEEAHQATARKVIAPNFSRGDLSSDLHTVTDTEKLYTGTNHLNSIAQRGTTEEKPHSHAEDTLPHETTEIVGDLNNTSKQVLQQNEQQLNATLKNVLADSEQQNLPQNIPAHNGKGIEKVEFKILPTSRVLELSNKCKENKAEACRQVGVHYLGVALETNNADRLISQTIAYLDKSCQLKDALGCDLLANAYGGFGTFYLQGQNVKQDINKASRFFKLGCNLSDPFACSQLGSLYFDGINVKKDQIVALSLFEQSCRLANSKSMSFIKFDSNIGTGCYQAGGIYLYGQEAFSDELKGVRFLNNACQLNYNQACLMLASYYEEEQQNVAKALPLLEQACFNNHADACLIGATRYNSLQEYEHSNRLLTQGCNLKNYDACTLLSSNLMEGVGIKQDGKKAFEMAIRSCQSNSALGCFYVGQMFKDGVTHVPNITIQKDLHKAARYFKQACELNHITACEVMRTVQEEIRATSTYNR